LDQFKHWHCLLLAALLPVHQGCAARQKGVERVEVVSAAATPAPAPARNVIIMIADGLGFGALSVARTMLHPEAAGRFAFEQLPHSGYQITDSKGARVTDSAAAASAWACGEKFHNGHLCIREDGSHPESILEWASGRGAATGLVVSATVTHATPGAFGAHVENRRCENMIASQYMQHGKIDVMLGGGRAHFEGGLVDACGGVANALSTAPAGRYVLLENAAQLGGPVPDPGKGLLGLFAAEHMTPEVSRSGTSSEPTLAQMSEFALNALARNPRGFFLLVEGSQVDMAAHANEAGYMLGEIRAFEQAVVSVLHWLDADPIRRRDTLLIVLADHETGGVARLGGTEEDVERADSVKWLTHAHLGTDAPMWSSGPFSELLDGACDNTKVYHAMRAALSGAQGD
jgi:alkaline phosphatase